MIKETTAGRNLRYMAPETILGNGCCFSGDVYSFGVLLWELLSLDIPFESIQTPSQYQVEVAGVEGYRPNIRRVGTNAKVPKSVKVLIQDCWDEDRSIRPTFSEVREVLESSVPQKRGEESARPTRRRGRGPQSTMFRLPGSSSRTRTTNKAAPLEVVVRSSSTTIPRGGPKSSSKRRVRKAPSESELTNTEGE
jgi:hypothetical protein